MQHRLLKDASRAGLYHLPAAHQTALPSAVAQAHQILLLADLSACKNGPETLRQLGKSCQFPSWYGANFDALYDCLTDPDWQPAQGLVLQISGLDTLGNSDPEGLATLLEVLRSAAADRSAGKLPLWILLSSPIAGVANLPAA